MTESTGMNKPRNVRFESALEYLERECSGWIRLTRLGAIDVIKHLSQDGVSVLGIEAGTWMAPGFKSNLEFIWDIVASKPFTFGKVRHSNAHAIYFAQACPKELDVFIITAKKYI